MPHESTVDPEEPMHFKSWGEEPSSSDPADRRRSTFDQVSANAPRFNHSLSMQISPDLPLHVTHDHDADEDPDDVKGDVDQDLAFDLRSKITYKPPKK